MKNNVFTSFHYLAGNNFIYVDKVEVKVFFIYQYQNIIKTVDIKKKKDASESYYINEATKIINTMIKDGSLIKYANKYIKKINRKKRLLYLWTPLTCTIALTTAGLLTYFIIKKMNTFDPSKWPSATREEVTAVINDLFEDSGTSGEKINYTHFIESLEKIGCLKGKLDFSFVGTSDDGVSIGNVTETFNFANDVYLKETESESYSSMDKDGDSEDNYIVYLDDDSHKGIYEFQREAEEKSPKYVAKHNECTSLQKAKEFVNTEIDQFNFDCKSPFFVGAEEIYGFYDEFMKDPKNVNPECHMKNEKSVYLKSKFVSDTYGSVHLELCFDEALLRICRLEYEIPNTVHVVVKQTIKPMGSVRNEYDPSWFNN